MKQIFSIIPYCEFGANVFELDGGSFEVHFFYKGAHRPYMNYLTSSLNDAISTAMFEIYPSLELNELNSIAFNSDTIRSQQIEACEVN